MTGWGGIRTLRTGLPQCQTTPMKIDAETYDSMKAWFARMIPECSLGPISADTDPLACLERIEAESPAKARQGLAMAIGDIIEDTDNWRPERIAAVNESLAQDGHMTLSDMQLLFSKIIKRVVRRGSIRTEVEYYAVRNAAEMGSKVDQDLWPLLSAYEKSQQR